MEHGYDVGLQKEEGAQEQVAAHYLLLILKQSSVVFRLLVIHYSKQILDMIQVNLGPGS